MIFTNDSAHHETQGVSETAATSHGNASDVGLLADEIDTASHQLLATTRKASRNWAVIGSALHIAKAESDRLKHVAKRRIGRAKEVGR